MRTTQKIHSYSRFSEFGRFIWEPNGNKKTHLQQNLPWYDAKLSAMFFCRISVGYHLEHFFLQLENSNVVAKALLCV